MKFDKRWLYPVIGLIFLFVSACGGSDETQTPDNDSEQQMCEAEQAEGMTVITCPDGSEFEIPHGEDGDDGADGEDGERGQRGEDGTSCTVEDNGDGTKTISCEDGTEATVEDGQDGEDGTICTVEDNGDGSYDLTCGDDTVTVFDGEDGQDGQDGADGEDGQDGESCTVVDNGDGSYDLTCGQDTVTISDGQDGQDGDDAGAGESCVISDNGDGTATLTCPDGTSMTVDVVGDVDVAIDAELEVTSFSVSVSDNDVTFDVTVTNNGPEDIPDQIFIDFFLDEDVAPEVGDIGDEFFEIADGLNAGQSVTVSEVVEQPNAGTYDAWTTVDPFENTGVDGDVSGPETYTIDEDALGPDFEISNFTVTVNGTEVNFEADVTNISSIDSDDFYVDFFLDEDVAPVPGDIGDVSEYFADGLDAGQSVTVTASAPQGEGTYDAWVTVDPLNDDTADADVDGPVAYTVADTSTDETADLVVSNFTVTVSGTDVTWSADVTNNGPDVADGFWVDFYPDEATAPQPGETGDSFEYVDTLADGATTTVGDTIQDVAAGTYDGWVQADVLEEIDDPDRSNNVAGPQTYTVN